MAHIDYERLKIALKGDTLRITSSSIEERTPEKLFIGCGNVPREFTVKADSPILNGPEYKLHIRNAEPELDYCA